MSSGELPFAGLAGRVSAHSTNASATNAALEWVTRSQDTALAARGRFSIALAGGSTPRPLYEALAASPPGRFDWPRWSVYFGDERACPPDDSRSNYHLARTTLLSRVPIPDGNVHRMKAERADRAAAAASYAALLAATLPSGAAGAPRIDCVLLGLGENGHTASLFPGSPSLDVRDRWAVDSLADYEPVGRITLTFPTLDAAAAIGFLVSGEAKRPALEATARGETPAARVHPADGDVVWFLDSVTPA